MIHHPFSRRPMAGLALLAGLAAPLAAHAGLTVSTSLGGAPGGVSYVNFDALPLGSGGGVSGGVSVSFTPDGQAVQGVSGRYAAPYLTDHSGAPFGDPLNGPDSTPYLTAGIGSVVLTLPGAEHYLGLLWGSVDSYNTLSLYDGATLIGAVTGTQVTASADGNQGAAGTFYVNIASTAAFDRVVASSSQYAFEFDNVAFSPTALPEPAGFGLLAAGLAVLGLIRRRR